MIIGRHGDPNLEHIKRDIKKFTSGKIIRAIRDNPQESRKELFLWLFERAGKRNNNNTHYQFWQQNNHPIELRSNKFIYQKLDYIHNNPVKAGIVLSPEEYLYSSAINYRQPPREAVGCDIDLTWQSEDCNYNKAQVQPAHIPTLEDLRQKNDGAQ